jgi:hypothetical protein
MRSLWKKMALRWLAGRASERLTGDSLIDLLMAPAAVHSPAFLVVRCEVSPHAIMAHPDRDHAAAQREIDEALAGAIGEFEAR